MGLFAHMHFGVDGIEFGFVSGLDRLHLPLVTAAPEFLALAGQQLRAIEAQAEAVAEKNKGILIQNAKKMIALQEEVDQVAYENAHLQEQLARLHAAHKQATEQHRGITPIKRTCEPNEPDVDIDAHAHSVGDGLSLVGIPSALSSLSLTDEGDCGERHHPIVSNHARRHTSET